MSVLRAGWGGGGWEGGVEVFAYQIFFSKMFKNVFFLGGGAPHAPTRGSRGVRKRYTSSYDHDL